MNPGKRGSVAVISHSQHSIHFPLPSIFDNKEKRNKTQAYAEADVVPTERNKTNAKPLLSTHATSNKYSLTTLPEFNLANARHQDSREQKKNINHKQTFLESNLNELRKEMIM